MADENVPEKTLEELYRDLSLGEGERFRFRTVQVEKRQDPVEELKRPLLFYDDRAFFYPGLLYGFCRVDSSVTERFREATGSNVRTCLHLCQHPLMEVAGFPQFTQTKVSRLLASIEHGPLSKVFFDFVSSQLIVDRRRQACWRTRVEMLTIPDPYLVDQKADATSVEIPVFVPYQAHKAYLPVQPNADGLGLPIVRAIDEDHPGLAREAKEALSG